MTTRPYEPLTSENAALILVDHQVGLMTGVRDYSTGELKHNVVALANSQRRTHHSTFETGIRVCTSARIYHGIVQKTWCWLVLVVKT